MHTESAAWENFLKSTGINNSKEEIRTTHSISSCNIVMPEVMKILKLIVLELKVFCA